MKKELTCIVCPVGCQLSVIYEKNKIKAIEGNLCLKGKSFAENETICPKRILTTTIPIKSRVFNRLPVRSDKPIPKKIMKRAINIVKNYTVSIPIKAGDILIKNISDDGANIISSLTINT